MKCWSPLVKRSRITDQLYFLAQGRLAMKITEAVSSRGRWGNEKKRKPNSNCYRSELTGIGRVTWGQSNVARSISSRNCQSLLGLHFYIFPSLINASTEWQKATSKFFLCRVYTHGHPHSPASLDTYTCIPHMMWVLVICKYVYYRERKYMAKCSIIVCFLFFYT